MSVILYNASKIRSFENLKALTKYVGETEELAEELWMGMLEDEQLLEEFNYFVANHTIKGEIKCGELSLLDLYFNQMSKYNYISDSGKNTVECDKDRMVVHAFREMTRMRKDPDYMTKYLKSESDHTDII